MIWIEVAETLPECGKKVLAYFENANGKPRRIMAYHADANSIESDSEDNYGAYEYSEEEDTYYLHEGWYENNEFDEINWMVDGKITHWMTLPDPPAK